MEAEDSFIAWGHPNITSKHRTTIMVTKDEHLSKKGDCIVAVRAERGLDDLSPELKQVIRNEEAEIIFTMETSGRSLVVKGRGHPGLKLTNPSDIVIRKSSFISDRTLMIKADIASLDIPLEFIQLLEDHDSEVHITIKATL
jgi:hypothetical protein